MGIFSKNICSANNCANEKILVCVYYGPTGERLIRRGGAIAKAFGCPLYILCVDHEAFDELDANKSDCMDRWKRLADESGAESFILRDKEEQSTYKVIAQVAREKGITQIVIGQRARSYWKQITEESLVDSLIKEIPFIDIHIISVARHLKDPDCNYEKGVRAYLVEAGDGYRLIFNHTHDAVYEGIFFKEVGTDFNSGIFKFFREHETLQVAVIEDMVTDFTNVELETQDDTFGT